MTIQTTPQTPAQAQPVPASAQKDIDWRQLDFAADGLVLRAEAGKKT